MKWYFIKNPSNNQEKTYTFFIWIRKKVLEKKKRRKNSGRIKVQGFCEPLRKDTDFARKAIQYFEKKKAIGNTSADEQKITFGKIILSGSIWQGFILIILIEH